MPMDNLAYDAVNLSPSNDTYSKLSTVQQLSTDGLYTRIELQDKSGGELSGVQDISKPSVQRKKTLLVAVAVLMAVLLLTSLVSIALSIGTYTRLLSVQTEFDATQTYISNILTQLNQDLSAKFQLVTSQNNISNILTQINQDLFSVKTQLVATQGNLSHTLPQLDARIEDFISIVQTQNASLQTQLYCGPGQWRRVAYLNMSDPTEHCPPVWGLYNTSGVRACGRRGSLSSENCVGMNFSTGYQYENVCGRVIGYQVVSPDAFAHHGNNHDTEPDGITITHGPQRVSHIWSYVASYSEMSSPSNCPCNGGTSNRPPQDIGSNYYCESGNPNRNAERGKLYSNDKLWDGQQCDSEGTCCSGTHSTKSPPWFNVRLPAPTDDSIEVWICCDQSTNDEDTPIELLELFVA